MPVKNNMLNPFLSKVFNLVVVHDEPVFHDTREQGEGAKVHDSSMTYVFIGVTKPGPQGFGIRIIVSQKDIAVYKSIRSDNWSYHGITG